MGTETQYHVHLEPRLKLPQEPLSSYLSVLFLCLLTCFLPLPIDFLQVRGEDFTATEMPGLQPPQAQGKSRSSISYFPLLFFGASDWPCAGLGSYVCSILQ